MEDNGIYNFAAIIVGLIFLFVFLHAHFKLKADGNNVTAGVIGMAMILFLAAGLGFKVNLSAEGANLEQMVALEGEKDEAEKWKERYETEISVMMETNTELSEENATLKVTLKELSQENYNRLIEEGKVKSENQTRPKIRPRSIDKLLKDGVIRKDLADRYSKTKTTQNN